jgi:DNA polymerase-3 subunit alpha
VEIARRCNLSVELGKNRLPDFPTPNGETIDDFLGAESRAGLEKRLLQLYPDATERESRRPQYAERLEFEIKTIQQMGFPGYFLIVADFIKWAKNNGVPVGPGRGSGAGSLVAYSLLITDLDPLRYELLFERFLNPERVSMPDFDIDFCQEGRDRVIDYVKKKYGAHAVSQIATFGTMAAKAVIRDVGRVLDLGFNFVDQFAKLIPNELGITLKDALEKEPAIRGRIDNEEEVAELWSLALKLEGLTRNVGMHAGGVLIAPGKLTDFCPLYAAAGADSVVSQFDKDDVEKAGLVKFDFLGLRTLTILDEAVRLVKEVEGVDIDLATLPLDDRATYDAVFKTANTTAVFQFESGGMKDTLVQAKPDRLEDLIALNALYRPGPMDFIPTFIARKHGRERVVYPHPSLEPVLANTYGIMVYQEQVMQTAQVAAGIRLAAPTCCAARWARRSPRKWPRSASSSSPAPSRTASTNASPTKSSTPWRSSPATASTSRTPPPTRWSPITRAGSSSTIRRPSPRRRCPRKWPTPTRCSSSWKDAIDNGLVFLPPDVNQGGIRFRPTDAKTIRYGLGAIKGTGEAALSVIVKARETGGPFTDLFDFCRRIDKRVVNRRVIEALIRAGAFDAIDDHRAKLLASTGVALEAAEQAERNAMQGGLFDMGGGARDDTAHYVEVPRWNEREQLMQEKPALGFFFSGHPYHAYARELASFVKRRLGQLEAQREPVLLAGVVMSTRTQMTRRGKMAVVQLDDGTTQLEITVFNELWEAERAKIKEDELLLVEGKVQRDDFSGGLRVSADKLYTLAEARGRYARGLQLTMNGGSDAKRLQALLAPFRNGPCPVRLSYRNGDAAAELPLPESWRVKLDDALLAGLAAWLKPENVKVLYS